MSIGKIKAELELFLPSNGMQSAITVSADQAGYEWKLNIKSVHPYNGSTECSVNVGVDQLRRLSEFFGQLAALSDLQKPLT